jgi:hypothetical protein
MASKENFFKAHWDWLAMGGGIAVLVASVAVLAGRFGLSPEDGAMRCEMRLKAAKPAHEGVAPADMTIFNSVLRTAKAPPAMMEIDSLKASFLASGTRIVCKAEKDAVGADGKPVKGCGRPVPIDVKECPYCLVVQDTGITKEEEGVKRKREWSARYGVDIVKNPDADSDKDGFTDIEEYEFASKGGISDPKDSNSHPDYLESLFVVGEMQQTVLPFYLAQVSPIPGGFRFGFRDFTKKNAYGQPMVYSVLKDEEIGKTGFSVAKHEKKTEERVVPGTKGKMKRKVEVSIVELVRKADGKKVVARLNERKVPVERQVDLVFRRGEEKKFTVKAGDKIKLFSREYQIVSFGGDVKSPEVKVADGLTKKESVITNAGKKQ